MNDSIIKITFLCGAFLFAACNQNKPPKEIIEPSREVSAPSQKILAGIDYIEANVIMPPPFMTGNEQIYKEEYARYYTFKDSSEKTEIIAIYIALDSSALDKESLKNTSKFHKLNQYQSTYFTQLDNVPILLDGGCSMITYNFDLDRNELTKNLAKIKDAKTGKMRKIPFHGECNGYA